MAKELAFTISEKKTIKTELPSFIAGIINVTPDSFCPEGRCSPEEGNEKAAAYAAERALKLVDEGANLIDIGAESTRPGYQPISEDEEIKRLVPALKAIRKVSDCAISVDTTKASVLKAALEAGADMLNDISALKSDISMAKVCRDAEIPVILMHNHDIMKVRTEETVESVSSFLAERVMYAVQSGIAPEKLIIDAGIGFGKTFEQNVSLIRNSRLIRALVLEKTGLCGDGLLPVMMALSRKSCIGLMTGREVEQRLSGTIAANLVAVQEGAVFVRVHDVAETRDMLAVLDALKNKE